MVCGGGLLLYNIFVQFDNWQISKFFMKKLIVKQLNLEMVSIL